ncbi:hypothetical protein SDC9_100762 [bioreactor metagenome]|uniref:Uncharacterized protein n=1 Tax=bioreactor metagenome TaxID=1076179 RepID=A0A645ALK2_9ZZZZ
MADYPLYIYFGWPYCQGIGHFRFQFGVFFFIDTFRIDVLLFNLQLGCIYGFPVFPFRPDNDGTCGNLLILGFLYINGY